MKLYDIAIAEELDGTSLVHTANCPHVRSLANSGYPVMTMLGCQGLPDMIKRHSCLENIDDNRRSAAASA